MVRLHGTDGHQRVGTLFERVGDQELELAGLVPTRREAEDVVALHPELGTAEFSAQVGHRLQWRPGGGVAAAWESGEMHGHSSGGVRSCGDATCLRRAYAPTPEALDWDLRR